MEEKKPIPIPVAVAGIVALLALVGFLAVRSFGDAGQQTMAPGLIDGKVPDIGTGKGAEADKVKENPNFYPSAPAGAVPGVPQTNNASAAR